MSIEVEFDATSALSRLHKAADDLVYDGVSEGLRVASERVRVGPTGQLRRGIEIVAVSSGYEMISSEPYSIFNEYGTGKYFEGEGASNKDGWVYFDERLRQFFTTYGMRPQPYMRPAFEAAVMYIEAEGRRRFGR